MLKPAWRGRLASLATLALTIGVAVLSYWLLLKWDGQSDWTHAKRNTLAAASVALLADIEGELTITAYVREQSTEVRKAIKQLVGRYQRYKPDMALSYVDPDAEPQRVRDLGIRVDGEMVVSLGSASEHVRSLREQDMSNALQRLLRSGERWLVFAEGHGERRAQGAANYDLASWVAQLESKGFKIANVNLAKSGGIPANATLLVIAGPQLDWLPGEVEHVITYLEAGGNLLWLAEPGKDAGLRPLADYLTISVDGATIIDPLARLIGIDNPTFAIVANYAGHMLFEGFESTTLFPQITAIRPTTEESIWQRQTLWRSGEQSWLERGELIGNVRLDDSDEAGPLPLALALTGKRSIADSDKEQRIVVIGDGDFLANQYLGNAGNLDLGLRIVNWLSADDGLINIPSSKSADRELELSRTESALISLGFLVALPALLALGGIGVWWRRRRH